MIKLDKPVIVEGKYDKITLENLIDAVIVTTDGFGIFKDKQKREFIRLLAQKNGIIVLTDSDSAGTLIRNHLKNIVPNEKIVNVFIPQIKGKEKRKAQTSKEGYLGVEGLAPDVLYKAFERAGITGSVTERKSAGIEKSDLFEAGLSGRPNSAEKRKKFLKSLGYPDNLSANFMLQILNCNYSREDIMNMLKSL